MSTATYRPPSASAPTMPDACAENWPPLDALLPARQWQQHLAWLLGALCLHVLAIAMAFSFRHADVRIPEVMSVSLLPMSAPAPTPPAPAAPQPPKPQAKPQAKPQPVTKPQSIAPETAISQPQPAASPSTSTATAATTQPASGSEKGSNEAPVIAAHNAAYLNNPRPNYPAMSRRLGEQGTVQIEVHVQADGTPANVGIKQSSGFQRLDESAREAVRRWRFVPAKRGNEAVAQTIITPVTFILEK